MARPEPRLNPAGYRYQTDRLIARLNKAILRTTSDRLLDMFDLFVPLIPLSLNSVSPRVQPVWLHWVNNRCPITHFRAFGAGGIGEVNPAGRTRVAVLYLVLAFGPVDRTGNCRVFATCELSSTFRSWHRMIELSIGYHRLMKKGSKIQ